MWKVKDKAMPQDTYIETWADSSGYVVVSKGEGGVVLHGKVRKGCMMIFCKSIEKQHPMILNTVIDEIGKDDEAGWVALKDKVREIRDRNKNNITTVAKFPFETTAE